MAQAQKSRRRSFRVEAPMTEGPPPRRGLGLSVPGPAVAPTPASSVPQHVAAPRAPFREIKERLERWHRANPGRADAAQMQAVLTSSPKLCRAVVEFFRYLYTPYRPRKVGGRMSHRAAWSAAHALAPHLPNRVKQELLQDVLFALYKQEAYFEVAPTIRATFTQAELEVAVLAKVQSRHDLEVANALIFPAAVLYRGGAAHGISDALRAAMAPVVSDLRAMPSVGPLTKRALVRFILPNPGPSASPGRSSAAKRGEKKGRRFRDIERPSEDRPAEGRRIQSRAQGTLSEGRTARGVPVETKGRRTTAPSEDRAVRGRVAKKAERPLVPTDPTDVRDTPAVSDAKRSERPRSPAQSVGAGSRSVGAGSRSVGAGSRSVGGVASPSVGAASRPVGVAARAGRLGSAGRTDRSRKSDGSASAADGRGSLSQARRIGTLGRRQSPRVAVTGS